MKKILIIQTASIGDVILSTPIIEKLHADFPEAKIDFLLKSGLEGLFLHHPFINNLLIWDKGKNKYRNLFRLLKKVRKNRYDLVVNVQRFFSTGLITAFSKGNVKTGFSKNPLSFLFTYSIKHRIGNAKNSIHESKRNLLLLDFLENSSPGAVKLYPSEQDFEKIKQYQTEKYTCIAPTSLWFTKQFPAEKWVEFVSQIDSSIKIFYLGSGSDFAACESILSKSKHHNGTNLAGKLSFLESATLMKSAVMNFVNDSAPMHLASAVNAPVTAIFCSTIPGFGFGPLSENAAIVETRELLKCRPCGLHGFRQCPEKHFKCAYTIDNQELLKRI